MIAYSRSSIVFQVDHEPFVEYVQKYFVDMKPTWSDVDNSDTFKAKTDKSIALFTGGLKQVRNYYLRSLIIVFDSA